MSNPIFPHVHDTIDDDGPRLPSAEPAPSGQPAAPQNGDEFAPYLPAPTPVAAPPAEPATFDAKAMVEGQKRVKTDPTYGAMPQGSSEGREAARQLREQANRKRRRSRTIARIVGVTLLGVVAAGAYFGYRAYQDRQDDDAGAVGELDGDADATDGAAVPDAADDGAGGADGDGSGEHSGDDGDGTTDARSAGAGLTPLGVIAEQLEAQSTLNEAAPDGIVGGFIQAMDDARSVVDEINDRSQGATDLADELTDDATDATDATDEGGLAAGGLTTLDAVVTRYDLGSPDAPVVQNVVADLAGDTYFVATTSDGEVLAAVETDAASHYQFDVGAGAFARAARGPLSLEAGPDGLFVAPISPRLVFPPSAVLHSTAIDIGLLDADGAPLVDTAYRIDVDGFLATAPDVAPVWLELLLRADPTALPSIDPGTVEALTDVPADELSRIAGEAADVLAAPAAVDATGAPEPAAGEAVLGWSVADNGLVDTLYFHLGDGRAHWLYQVDDFDAPAFGPVFGPALAPT